MAHRAGKKEESRARILTSAGRGFRSRGFGGSGVDGLAKDAEVTSGAFYAHFKSKAAAFREAVVVGLEDLRRGIGQAREQMGGNWRGWFVDFYLGERRTCDLAESCALQSLSSEVARADDETRQAYETELRSIIEAMAAGLEGKPKARREEATALLALLVMASISSCRICRFSLRAALLAKRGSLSHCSAPSVLAKRCQM